MVSKKNTVKKVSKSVKKSTAIKAKPKNKVVKVKPARVINMTYKEPSPAAELNPSITTAELPPPIPDTFFNSPVGSVSLKDPNKQMTLPLPVDVPAQVKESPAPQPVKKRVAKPIQAKKVYSNTSWFKSLSDMALGGLIRTVFGGLIVGGFIGFLQFCTKLAVIGFPFKAIVIFTIVSYLVGMLLDKKQ